MWRKYQVHVKDSFSTECLEVVWNSIKRFSGVTPFLRPTHRQYWQRDIMLFLCLKIGSEGQSNQYEEIFHASVRKPLEHIP
jgi:hypothetical protein